MYCIYNCVLYIKSVKCFMSPKRTYFCFLEDNFTPVEDALPNYRCSADQGARRLIFKPTCTDLWTHYVCLSLSGYCNKIPQTGWLK